MTTAVPNPTLQSALDSAFHEAGLEVFATEQGATKTGQPTSIYMLGLPGKGSGPHVSRLELSTSLDVSKPDVLPELIVHLKERAVRLRNPRPDAYVTFGGIPISLTEFAWPFHQSVSGSDTYIVHGLVTLADGTDAGAALHAKVAASLTLTFAEVLPALEQPYAESFIYNAARKRLDQGQLEVTKSGNLQPIPVTMRYYSRWKKQFIFIDSTAEQRKHFLASKIYWCSGVLGNSEPVWIADPRDAQYLNTTPEDLAKTAEELASEGMLQLGNAFASATPRLMDRAEEFRAKLKASLDFTKPTFNEEMRAGHTNM